MPAILSPQRIQDLTQIEQRQFALARPQSQALSVEASEHMLYGVPLHWMRDWPLPFTLFIDQAQGAHLTDVDGHRYVDFCLGDTGAMFGHAPPALADALASQVALGMTAMLPSEDAVEASRLLSARFNLPFWQFTLSASDANRFVLRWARAITGRRKVLVFDGCYHGTVDDTLVDYDQGQTHWRASLLGTTHARPVDTVAVEFNDLAALEAALRSGEVACVLAEPVMTNVGMVLPQPGFWEAANTLIRQHGSLLVMDETHTLSTGPSGYCGEHRLQPDMLVIGKAIGGGLPCAVYGFSASVASRMQNAKDHAPDGHSGIGTTLSANLLTTRAIRTTLESLMTTAAYAHMGQQAESLARGLEAHITRHDLPWCVTRIGARCEFQFCSVQPRTGQEARAAMNDALEALIHLYLLNRGVLITPFHNMLLVSPHTRPDDVSRLLAAFGDCLDALCA
ncbi:aspartate aminotransferase family protein [Parachitinimonas caeni]|uniref:Aspartate aminotransferase family protein n=1 Tax=Parachitinimonas caeni TaxID=3031301 RepID=A0ABT7DYS9_9NEIS|nr:aspartate aminotransferase family protein [Parachitinimonas caeni]MDK2125201.1 aspartate aminotransferase family protein [Parachitinimonas caeni]